MEAIDKVLVAVYGTLRTGEGNHRCMVRADGKSLGLGKTLKNYNLYNLGAFPKVSLTRRDHKVPVTVEVFETDLNGLRGPLDMLEGYPSFYDRTQVDVVLDSGETVKAWIYHIENDSGLSAPIKSGDWVKRNEEV